jgi:LacI family transcriptional regulator
MGSTSGIHPTLRQVAIAARVSATTVSLALRNHPRIPVSTRERIQALGRQMGYCPNPSVSTVMSQVRSGSSVRYRETLAWINPFGRPDHFVDKRLPGLEYSQKLWEGAVHRAEQLGYALESFWLREENMSGLRVSAILAARGIRGLLIPPLPRANGHLSLDWSNFSVTALSFTMVRPQFHRVVPDHHHNLQIILRTLRHRGYERVGLLLPLGYDERLENRFRAAFYFHHQNVPLRCRIPALICPDKSYEASCAGWLKKYRPDAVITLGTFRNLREIQIGDETYSKKIGVVLMGCGAVRDQGFTVMDENPFRIAQSAIDHLAGQLSRNERGIPDCPETVLIKGAWIDGQTIEAPAVFKGSPRASIQDFASPLAGAAEVTASF